MAVQQLFRAGIISLENSSINTTAQVRCGSNTTRATVLAECDDGFNNPPIGSLYLSSAGKAYLRVAAAGAATDWQKVTTTAAD